MSGLKDFLAMTRHERRGTIVVLVVIAVILAMTAMVQRIVFFIIYNINHILPFFQRNEYICCV